MDPRDEATARIVADLNYLGQLMIARALPDRTLGDRPKERGNEDFTPLS
jgi:hypothetical protein